MTHTDLYWQRISTEIVTDFLLNEYIASLKIQWLTYDSIWCYIKYIKNFILIAEFQRIQDFENFIKLKFWYYKLPKRGISNNTLYKYYKCIKKYYYFLEENNLVTGLHINKIQKSKTTSALPKSLREEEVQIVRDFLQRRTSTNEILEIRDWVMFETILFTGLRRKEVANLQRKHIHKKYILIENGKGQKDRVIYINNHLSKILGDWLDIQNISPYMFYDVKNRQLTTEAVTAIFKRISRATKVHITPHLIRHTYASICVKRGINLYTLQQQMGHSSLKTTSIYLYLNSEENFQEMQKLRI